MKKRALSILLALAMLCALALPGLAVPAGGWVFEELLPCQYDELRPVRVGDLILAQKNGKWGILDQAGDPVVPFQYDDIGQSQGLSYNNASLDALQVAQNGKWGLIFGTEAGEGSLPCRYDEGVKGFRDGAGERWMFQAAENGKWGLLDEAGETVVPFQYDDMGKAESGRYVGTTLIRVEQDGKQGFIDQNGTVLIPLTYTDARDFSRDLAAVADQQGRWGYIDKQGQTVLDCQYSAVGDFYGSPCLAPVKTADGTWQFIDQWGAVQITCQDSYDQVGTFGYGKLFAVAVQGDKLGLIDREGREVLSCRYDRIDVAYPSESWTAYGSQKTYPNGETGWEYGLISPDGTLDTGLVYERNWELYATYPAEGLMSVSKFTGLSGNYPTYAYGYLDAQTGEVAIPLQYDYAEDFYGASGLAPVEKDGKAGYIDTSGQVVIPMTYGMTSAFGEDSMALVAMGNWPDYRWGLIDAQGNTLMSCTYPCEYMYFYGDSDMIIARKDDRYGLLKRTRQDALSQPISGAMEGSDGYSQMNYACSEIGKLSLMSYLPEGEMALAVTYDTKGKLTGVELLTADKPIAWVDTGAARAKLFWLGENQQPMSQAATLWER